MKQPLGPKTAIACAGKYFLKAEPAKGQGVISGQAVEKFPPGRNVVCRFFVSGSAYRRECAMLARLPAGEQVPGERLRSAYSPLLCSIPLTVLTSHTSVVWVVQSPAFFLQG